MKIIKNILRCYAMGMGIKGISNTFLISRNTVRKYVRKFLESGIPMDTLLSMKDSHLQEIFTSGEARGRKPSSHYYELEALLPEYCNRLRRKGVSILSLYKEYHLTHPEGLRYASFSRYLQRYRLSQRVIGHVEHYAAEQMYIDFAGDKLKIYDSETAEPKSVEVFVAILPCSHYTYCEAVWTQKKEDLILACENALHFYGGAPQAIVPDNLKSAVTRSDKHEPVINEEFASFAEHYGCVVYPARVRHPKDKALVENAVKLMYRHVYTDLEGMMFQDLASLNAAIHASLEKFNAKKMSGRKESRKQLFDALECDYLRELPQNRYMLRERKSVTVMSNIYVTLHKHHYSVPKEYVGKRVEIIYDNDSLEIYNGMRLITTHRRDDTPYGYTTKSSHNLPGRTGSYEKDIEDLFLKAGSIDNIVLVYLKEVAQKRKYPPQAFRTCRGILSLQNKYGTDRLVAACMCATQKRVYGYQQVHSILQDGEDAPYLQTEDSESEHNAQYSSSPLKHQNIRGREYFTSELNNQSNINNKQSNGNK